MWKQGDVEVKFVLHCAFASLRALRETMEMWEFENLKI